MLKRKKEAHNGGADATSDNHAVLYSIYNLATLNEGDGDVCY